VLVRDTFGTQIFETNYTHADLYTNAWFDVDGNNVRVRGMGLDGEMMNWITRGFVTTRLQADAYPEAPSSDLTNSLVAYWKLDEDGTGTRADSSGNDYSLTSANVNYTASGVVSNAATFSGSASAYLSRASDVGFNSTTFTIAGWVYVNSPSTTQAIWTKDSATAGSRQWYTLSSATTGSFRFGIAPDNSTMTFVSDAYVTVQAETWYFVVAKADLASSTISIRVGDDTTLHAGNTSYPVPTWEDFSTAQGLVFGKLGASSYVFGGIMDEVGFWSRALSDTEVEALWAAGAGSTHPWE
jgi:hypothetical protein